MCDWRVVLIWSIIHARVVDLPEPAGPVTSTRPFLYSENSIILSGINKSSGFGMLKLITRITADKEPRCLYALILNLATPANANEKSSSPHFLKRSILRFPARE